MTGTTLLVPVRFPITNPTVRTLERATDLAGQVIHAHLYVLHVNLLHRREHVHRSDLQAGVERALGLLPNASYHVREAYLLEEAILDEARKLEADFVVIGHSLQARWRRIVTARLGISSDLESFLSQHLNAELVVN